MNTSADEAATSFARCSSNEKMAFKVENPGDVRRVLAFRKENFTV